MKNEWIEIGGFLLVLYRYRFKHQNKQITKIQRIIIFGCRQTQNPFGKSEFIFSAITLGCPFWHKKQRLKPLQRQFNNTFSCSALGQKPTVWSSQFPKLNPNSGSGFSLSTAAADVLGQRWKKGPDNAVIAGTTVSNFIFFFVCGGAICFCTSLCQYFVYNWHLPEIVSELLCLKYR